jgi:PKHD-type hydroxylase
MKKNKKIIPKFNNSSWNFQLDKVNSYAFYKEVFSKEECKKIIDLGENKGFIEGQTMGGKSNLRDSYISWLYPTDKDTDWLFRKTTDLILFLNNKYFNFDIFGLNEGFQFTNYKAPSGKYGKHIDKSYDFPVRKLSISIQLTNPEEYEGGELFLYDGDDGVIMEKSQGSLIIFPSYVLHEVTPVTKGERNSLVTWVTGNQFK